LPKKAALVMAKSRFVIEMFGRDFYASCLTKRYDTDLYRCFLLANHAQNLHDKKSTCWYRKGVVYSGIKFVMVCDNVEMYEIPMTVKPSTVFCANIWCYKQDSIHTMYYKLYSSDARRVFRFRYPCMQDENYNILGGHDVDSRFEYAFHKAITDIRKEDDEVIQNILYHIGVLVSLYIVKLARFALDVE
jgi:hypothetical protein